MLLDVVFLVNKDYQYVENSPHQEKPHDHGFYVISSQVSK